MIAEFIGGVLVFIGLAFNVFGVIGILRLPDTYTRLHASGKVSTLGVIFLCVGVSFIMPSAAPKLIALSIFVIFSAPVGSHAIAAAVHRGTAVQNREAQEHGETPTQKSGVHRWEDIQAMLNNQQDQSST